MSRNKLLTNQCKHDRPCTSKPRKWGYSWEANRDARAYNGITSSQDIKLTYLVEREGECHRLFMTHVQLRAEGLTRRQLKILEKLFSEQIRPFLSGKWLLISNSSDIVLVDSLVGKVARGSVLHLQLKDFSTPNATPTSNFNTPSPTTTRISCLQPLPVITNDNTPRSDSTTDINMNVGVDEAH